MTANTKHLSQTNLDDSSDQYMFAANASQLQGSVIGRASLDDSILIGTRRAFNPWFDTE